MDLELNGKIAFITGGSSGIGLAIKKSLEEEGVICYSFSRREGVDLLTDEGINFVMKYINKADILIHSCGGGGTWTTDFQTVMYKNYFITQQLTDVFVHNRKEGKVVTIASLYGTNPGPNPNFASCKAAQIMYMKSMAKKYPHINFNSVSPSEVSDAGTPKNVKLKSQDVANLVVFLCSDKAKQINGENIVLI
jgi:NAD(P)-dependent dehydrogenase (short-subunit alcohol dehydrogenase family)